MPHTPAMSDTSYTNLLSELKAILTPSEWEVFATKAIIRLSEMNDGLLAALKASQGYMMNAAIDLQTGTKKQTTLDTLNGGIKLVAEAIAKAEGR